MEDYRLWKQWAKHNKDGWFYGLCVLLGIRHSPSFEMYYKGFASYLAEYTRRRG